LLPRGRGRNRRYRHHQQHMSLQVHVDPLLLCRSARRDPPRGPYRHISAMPRSRPPVLITGSHRLVWIGPRSDGRIGESCPPMLWLKSVSKAAQPPMAASGRASLGEATAADANVAEGERGVLSRDTSSSPMCRSCDRQRARTGSSSRNWPRRRPQGIGPTA
jgi:hypothetical protein